MQKFIRNPLQRLDVYKMGHLDQINPRCTKMYSYYCNRSDKYFDEHVFFGLQYYLKEYLCTKLEPWMAEKFIDRAKRITGSVSENAKTQIRNLCSLGYYPLKIKSLPEGSITKKGVPLFTITNTINGFQWLPGFVESLLLKCWYPSAVATTSYKYRKLVNKLFDIGVDQSNHFLKPFMVHDFGYRADTSEESAEISGVAHLLSFVGSDTVPAFDFACEYYGAKEDDLIMQSVPASEHSVACSYGKEGELEYFERMLDLYPEGIVSIVSDQYDVYKFFSEYSLLLKSKIESRNGITVLRPDSGNSEDIICGKEWSSLGQGGYGDSPEPSELEKMGVMRILDRNFGHTINSKGLKVLKSTKIIYGDGQYYERYEKTQKRLISMGYSPENLVIGVGGILRNHTRDTLGCALKATYVEIDSNGMEIFKDPITDSGKKSARGLLRVDEVNGTLVLKDRCTLEEEQGGLLTTVFENGILLRNCTLQEIRNRLSK